MEIKGTYAEAHIYADLIEQDAVEQIKRLCSHIAFQGAKIRIMPDVHAGAGCVIGFTADLGEKVVPNLVGVDIGCGMRVIKLGNVPIDFQKLDHLIQTHIPAGFAIHEKPVADCEILKQLFCRQSLQDSDRIQCSIGTLGGGNHFIECDEDPETNCRYLIIHTGSRNLGKQVAQYYQKQAVAYQKGEHRLQKKQQELIEAYQAAGRERELSAAIKKLRNEEQRNTVQIPEDLSYLEGDLRDAYLHDMKICQQYAAQNRQQIGAILLEHMGWEAQEQFETIHNYIDHESNIVRKGAISARAGEKVLIPINMRDGCILAVGKGNDEWNCSAPHGAGRLMSRSRARKELSMEEYKAQMAGIYTSSVVSGTLDEAPMAYKPLESILSRIHDTVTVKKILKPVYNFKAT